MESVSEGPPGPGPKTWVSIPDGWGANLSKDFLWKPHRGARIAMMHRVGRAAVGDSVLWSEKRHRGDDTKRER